MELVKTLVAGVLYLATLPLTGVFLIVQVAWKEAELLKSFLMNWLRD